MTAPGREWNFKQTRAKLLEGKIAIKTQGESGVVNTVDEMNRKLDATEGGAKRKAGDGGACLQSQYMGSGAGGASGIHACPWLHIEFKINRCYRSRNNKYKQEKPEVEGGNRHQ